MPDDLRDLEDDLAEFNRKIIKELKKVTSKAGLNIKNDAKTRLRRHVRHRSGGHVSDLPRTITYDVRQRKDSLLLEVGPDLNRQEQAPLGGLVEFGVAAWGDKGTLGSAPRPYLAPALETEVPKFQEHIGRVAERLFDGRTQ